MHKADVADLTQEDEANNTKKHTPLDDIAAEIAGEHHRLRECPGEPYVALADLKACTHGGADIHVDFDDEDIEEFFADNVVMREWRYFLNDCDNQKAECELINPDVNHHQYPVGKTEVRVEGFDLAGNMNKCLRTVYILDKQAPSFEEPEVDLNQEIELHFPEDSCKIYGGTPFTEYEEQAGFTAHAKDNCDDDVVVVRKLFDHKGEVIYDSTVNGTFPSLTGPGEWKMCYLAIDDYAKNLDGVHAFGKEPPHDAGAVN